MNGIKIDRAVSVALGAPVGNALTKAVVDMAAELQLRTTIEGIETAQQARVALDLGCDFGQGYRWSEPVPAATVDRNLCFRDGFSRTVPAGWSASTESSGAIQHSERVRPRSAGTL